MTAAAAIREVDPATPAAMLGRMASYGDATRAELHRYLDNGPAAPFLDDLLADYPSRGGKMLRPAICIANARVFGGSLECRPSQGARTTVGCC